MGAEQSTEAPPAPEAQTQTGAHEQPDKHIPAALVICGPSGVGKGTLIRKLMEGNERFGFSCSHTTRSPREGEQNGVHYWFTSKELMQQQIKDGKFLETASVHGQLYGTSRRTVQSVAASGKSCILDIDVQGARQVREAGLNALFVFIAPPSDQELEKRLRGRGTESEEQIQQRMANAKAEIGSVNEEGLYDYVVFNNEVEDALAQLKDIAEQALQGLSGQGAKLSKARDAADAIAASPKGSQQSGTPKALAASNQELQPLLANPNGPTRAEPPGGAAGSQPASPAPVPDAAAGPSSSGGSSGSSTIRKLGAAASSAASTAAAAVTGTQPAAEAAAGDAKGDTSAAAVSTELSANEFGMVRWKGKVALVTGASSGIGRAICVELAQAGMRVVAIARRRDRLEDLQQELVGTHSMPIAHFLPVVCDITKEAEVVALPRIISKRWPEAGIDVLVNNAGLGRNNASLFEGSTQSWVEMVSTNVLGVCMCTREAVQDMKRRGKWGQVINISSMSGHRIVTAGGSGFYSATKQALRTLTETLRQEARALGVPLRVSSVSPGVVDTEFFNTARFGQAGESLADKMEALAPQDVAHAVVWALEAPPRMDVNDILVRPTAQSS
ncbi:hypothetical protein WJX74_009060 [Apatococcus lobatus]|uniref:guanylate kinase n=2 Tax=Apatococcus TaxID=904362 RepID=A0AAW1SUE5_9CHLO